MKLSIISFTEKGRQLSEKIAESPAEKIETELFTKHQSCYGENGSSKQSVRPVESSVAEWAGKQMREKNALLFIGACGIAVRAIAPHLTDKLHDSPVLVMDEKNRYVIPILSGHAGGANELALYLARKTGAEPVITTATDINGKFAADLFAKKNQLFIVNKEGIARVSAKALAGEEITLSAEPGHGTVRAVGIRQIPYPPQGPVDILVTSEEGSFDALLFLRPREYVIGFGCKKGKQEEEIETFILHEMKKLGISLTQVAALASISLKKREPGILAWCRKKGIPFLTYTAEELQETEGDFAGSSFVKEQVGVDNVCERAAVRACGPGGELIAGKYAKDGMTIAVARRNWEIRFGEPLQAEADE